MQVEIVSGLFALGGVLMTAIALWINTIIQGRDLRSTDRKQLEDHNARLSRKFDSLTDEHTRLHGDYRERLLNHHQDLEDLKRYQLLCETMWREIAEKSEENKTAVAIRNLYRSRMGTEEFDFIGPPSRTAQKANISNHQEETSRRLQSLQAN